jgi:hypothetical protein
MSLDEETLAERLTGRLFLLPPQDVECDLCGHKQKVPVPVQVTRVKNRRIHGAGGSMIYVCESCRSLPEVTWDSANVEVTEFLKE